MLASTGMRATRPVVVIVTVLVALSWPGTRSSGLAATRPAVVTARGGPVRALAAALAGIGKPTARGRLRIAGPLRDGRTVRAAGLYWRPGLLPRGDKLLSFEIGYTWRSCAAKCAAAADSTVTRSRLAAMSSA